MFYCSKYNLWNDMYVHGVSNLALTYQFQSDPLHSLHLLYPRDVATFKAQCNEVLCEMDQGCEKVMV